MSGEPADGVFRPADLIEYQPGGIVSRVLLKQPTGSVTLFAFDAGQELSEHSTPHAAMIQVLEGRAAVRIAATTHQVGAGEIVELPADVPHAVRADDRFKMLLTMLRRPS